MSQSDSNDDMELYPIEQTELDTFSFEYTDKLSLSPMIDCAVQGDIVKAKQLIKSGHSVNINDNQGNTPLHVSIIRNKLEIFQYFLAQKEIFINTQNFYGHSPLLLASKARFTSDATFITSLLDYNADVNLGDNEGNCPLHVASVKFSEILIKKGADINCKNHEGSTPINEATLDGNYEKVCMLLYYNANVNLPRTNYNRTPLINAIIKRNVKIEQLLFDFVYDFNTISCSDLSLLQIGLICGSTLTHKMVDSGANVNYITSNGDHVLKLSIEENKLDELIYFFTKCNYDFYNRHFYSILSNISEHFLQLGAESICYLIESILDIRNVLEFPHDHAAANDLIEKFCENKIEIGLLTNFVSLLFSYGLVLNINVLDSIYEIYGYCEAFQIARFMDINLNTFERASVFINAIFNMDFNINDYQCHIWKVCPKRDETKFYFTHFEDFYGVGQIPSLLELARNKTRASICRKFKVRNNCQYYSILNNILMPEACRKCLTFEKKIYTD